MFSKEEEKEFKSDFWQGLNSELELRKGVHGNKVNWTNFNTGIKHLYFRMDLEENFPKLCIDMQFPNEGIRELYYEQFTEFKDRLDSLFESELIWLPRFEHSNTRTIARICIENKELDYYRREDWPAMYAYFGDNFQKLEAFWNEFNEVFFQLK
jgi:hypothetical protein